MESHVLHEVLRWLSRRFDLLRGRIWRLLEGVPAEEVNHEAIAALEVLSREVLQTMDGPLIVSAVILVLNWPSEMISIP